MEDASTLGITDSLGAGTPVWSFSSQPFPFGEFFTLIAAASTGRGLLHAIRACIRLLNIHSQITGPARNARTHATQDRGNA